MIGPNRLSAACREAREAQSDPIAVDRVAIHKRHCDDCKAWDGVLADIQNVSTADDQLDELTRARIQQRLAKRVDELATVRARPVSRRPWLGAAIAAAAVVLMALLYRGGTEDTRPLSVPSGGRVAMRVGEAYFAFLGPSEAKLPKDLATGTVIELLRGRLLVEVEHRSDRDFVVLTPEAKVRVVGTLFAVTVDNAGRTFVDVRRGVVEVTSNGEIVRVEAGRGWDRAHGLRAIDPELDHALKFHGAPEPEPIEEHEVGPGPIVEPSVVVEPEVEAPVVKKRAPVVVAPTAESRYAEAEKAMAEGDQGRSESILTALVRDFPTDPLAGTALYELARLSYDHGERAPARAHLEELLSRGADPSLLESAHYLLCRLSVDEGEIGPAYDCLVRFRRSFGGSTRDAEVLATIAQLAERRGGCVEAETWWAEYLRLYPTGAKAAELESRRAACAP